MGRDCAEMPACSTGMLSCVYIQLLFFLGSFSKGYLWISVFSVWKTGDYLRFQYEFNTIYSILFTDKKDHLIEENFLCSYVCRK